MTAPNINTFGDARRIILETIVDLRSGTMDISRGMAIAANFKVLNDNMQVELNAAKVSMTARQLGHDFGAVMTRGQLLIGSEVT